MSLMEKSGVNGFKTTMLLAALTALFMGLGYIFGGSGGAMIALVVAAGMNIFTFWNADKIVLRLHNAREVDARAAPEFYHLVAELAQRAGLPMPRVYVIDSANPNAFAVCACDCPFRSHSSSTSRTGSARRASSSSMIAQKSCSGPAASTRSDLAADISRNLR